jgi:tRNA G10  N-methylase Trm11
MNDLEIGGATVLLGDCLELMKRLPDASVDMILCDLPYGTTACSWDSITLGASSSSHKMPSPTTRPKSPSP